ncbi:ABC transporter permease [Prevotella sp.]|uniref:ABC transporter permease n=1 Tax=Prevotella sp. TaxID=59823 RepID=UPI003FD77E18
MIKELYNTARRETGIILTTPVYIICMVVLPLFVMIFFTTLMQQGQPNKMPVGIVDLDNTTTTRSMTRKLDAFQNTNVVAFYNSVDEARQAIQENKIYGFMYFPKGTTDKLLASRQPKISFYYTYTSLTAGALLYKDLKTIATLGSASVGLKTMSAKGFTDKQIKTFLQPIAIDMHAVRNPWTNYNFYLTTMLVPGCMMLFIFLITPYSFGTELKFNRAKKLLAISGENIWAMLLGKLLPHTLIFLVMFYIYSFYTYGLLGFPHEGGTWHILLLGLLAVTASQGFGAFMFGLIPSLRMSMSTCSLWAVLSFSLVGTAFPIFAMDAPLEGIAQLFPLRHYFRIYQTSVFNDFPLSYVWINVVVMIVFSILPVLVAGNIRKAMREYKYIE